MNLWNDSMNLNFGCNDSWISKDLWKQLFMNRQHYKRHRKRRNSDTQTHNTTKKKNPQVEAGRCLRCTRFDVCVMFDVVECKNGLTHLPFLRCSSVSVSFLFRRIYFDACLSLSLSLAVCLCLCVFKWRFWVDWSGSRFHFPLSKNVWQLSHVLVLLQ